eukprot:TRINITY_DN18632_c0_g1_i4.p1 TRINITY_DN18632_c0_g1~~TRINITY_DN18632_c0_g1_i4.p1  ORF type:complete len:980 (-),score=267.96 TRINITY_DN18632_c0_g1_i4:71-3010(-)
MLLKAGILLFILKIVQPKATIANNGYEDIVVAISPDVPEDLAIIDNLKELLTKTSEELYRASRKRSYMKSIRILLPQSWTYSAEPAVAETAEDAEFVVNTVNPAYGHNPYTVQNGECGEAGDFTHLTPWFVVNHDTIAQDALGRTDKILVHEWAKLRWGVFEEYGYPGDEKFPMFYYKSTWGPNGQEDVLKPNFCTSIEVTGTSKDISTGGVCTDDAATGLPNEKCYFLPDKDNQVASSYMALPFLDSVTDFCDDDSEDTIHHAELPTKHNLYCDGKSTWAVISENEDFANGANEAAEIPDTTPEFIIVKPQNARYVVVMDVSGSMVPTPPNMIDRATNLKDAAKRWVKYEVTDGTEVALVTFSDVQPTGNPFIYNLNRVDEQSREDMVAAIDQMDFKGQTCIGCGLDRALNWPGGLKDTVGGVIILITDGVQKCSTNDGCFSIGDMTDEVVNRQVRVVTIALGLDADPELEQLAIKTGGKSYFIDDSSGPGNINDAFSGSQTYQPGDVLGNTNTVVHQKDFTPVTAGEAVLGFYDIDASIGRDVTVQVEVKTKLMGCAQNLSIILVSPDQDPNHTVDVTYQCTTADFGVFRHQFTDLAVEGRWVYKLTPQEDLDSISIKVESKSRKDSTEPIMTKCWIATGSQEIDTNVNVKLAVVAQVTQGTKPVIGANVIAEVERPADSEGTTYPPMVLELADNGSGADKIKNDGTYSRYFAKFTGKGRYSVKCQVAGDESTGVNGGFTGDRVYPQVPDPHSPLCCGSNALSPDAKVTKTGNFTRQAAGGGFQVMNDVEVGVDKIPPGQVTDLTVVDITKETITIEFTAPGNDLDSNDIAAEYIIKYSSTGGNLTGGNFDLTDFNTFITKDNLFDSNLDPVNGGSIKQIKIKSTIFDSDRKYMLAMKAKDEADNYSPVSNKVQLFIQTISALETTPTTNTTTTTTATNTTTTATETTTTTPSGSNGFKSEISVVIVMTILSKFALW